MTFATTGQSLDMLQDAAGLATSDVEAPWSRVDFAPPASWVELPAYNQTAPGNRGAHLTHLLWERQIEAGTGLTFHAAAVRLETVVAVQDESQWSLPFNPRTQRVTLHWLRVVRDGRRIEQLDRDKVFLIQRDTQLERLVIDGTWTLVSTLEDLRPGDVLESAFSIETRHPIRASGCEVFFGVPPQAVVGRYRLIVSLPAAVASPAWRASVDAPARIEETRPDGIRRWVWSGEQLTPREAEPNQPSHFIDRVWIQVSDLSGWDELAQLTFAAWAGVGEADGLATQPGFARPERVDAAAVNGLVERIQNDFRYLSVTLDAGGWIPASPSLIARRRFGDSKDFAWLATCVLRAWGLAARTILVGTGLRGALANLLPMAGLLDHAILEIEVEGQLRWFDLTQKLQGGDYSGRAVGWFERGVAVDAVASGLCAQPGAKAKGVCILRETLWLDTARDGLSLVEQRVRVEGWQADELRRARLGVGAEEFIKLRETEALRRYGKIRRIGELAWRDDRAANVCELVECFEIARAVYPDKLGRQASFDMPPSLFTQVLALPENRMRRGPWSLPFPCELRHEIEVRAASLMPGLAKRRRWNETEFSGTLDEYRKKGAWSKRVCFVAVNDAVASERIPLYRRQLDEFLRATGGTIQLPWGLVRPHRPPNFGQLAPVSASEPTSSTRAESSAAPVLPLAADPRTARVVTAEEDPKLARGVSSRRHHARTASVAANPAPDRGVSLVGGALLRYGWIVIALVLLGVARGCSLLG
jgi:transglutaminase-like putative cysteine protease